jgi:hypothetical protein
MQEHATTGRDAIDTVRSETNTALLISVIFANTAAMFATPMMSLGVYG